MDKTMSSSPLDLTHWITQMNYPNMHQPFDFFCFVFDCHNKHHEMEAIILNIKNPLFEI